MKLSHHPESLRELPPDRASSRPAAGRSRATFWVTLIMAVLPALLLFRAPLPRLELLPWWVELFSLPAALIGGLYLAILWHELGHLVAASLTGFLPVLVMVGPLQWTRTLTGWKLLHSGFTGFIVQGRVMALPPEAIWFDPPEIRRRLLLILAAGPLATLIQALFLFALLFLAPAGTFNQVTRTVLIALALLSMLFLGWTTYPLALGEQLNDMAQIRRLQRLDPTADRLLALLALNAMSVAGVRPANLDEATVDRANTRLDGTSEGLAGRLFAVAQAEDRGEMERLAYDLDEILASIRRLPPDRRPAPVLWEVASFAASQGDAGAARGWLDLADRVRYPMFIEAQIARLAAETAVALVEADQAAAAAAAHRLRKLLPFSYNKGGLIPIREWLARTIGENHLEDPDPRPLRQVQLIWRPIAVSFLLTALVILGLSFIFVLIILR